MTSPTAYNPNVLEAWSCNEETFEQLQQQMEAYFQKYDKTFHTNSQRKLFQAFIKGLLSPLERKSIEPIALRFLGEDGVRCLQKFLTCSPFEDAVVMAEYQRQLSAQVDAVGRMLSVDDTGFVQKGNHSIGVKRQYGGHLGKRENCQVGVFLAYAGEQGYGRVFLTLPEMTISETKKGCPRKYPMPSHPPVTVESIAEDDTFPWETVVLTEGAKGPIVAERKILRCFACRNN